MIAEQVVLLLHKQCACSLSPEAQGEIVHMMGMFKDVGNRVGNPGGHSQGIEVFRALGLRFVRTNRVAEHVVKGITYSLVFSAGVGVLLLIWYGCRVVISEIIQSIQSVGR